MFVGFIAVIVILLVIVGLMSSGATNGSGGVDQTKATKALSEVSALVQSTGYYKTTSASSDYSSISMSALTASGIISTNDTVTAGATYVGDAGTYAGTETVIKSKAVAGLYYNISAGSGTLSNSTFKIDVVVDPAVIASGSSLASAIESSMGKLTATAAKNSTASAITVDTVSIAAGAQMFANKTANDGSVAAEFN